MDTYESHPTTESAISEYAPIRGFKTKEGSMALTIDQMMDVLAEIRTIYGEWDRFTVFLMHYLFIFMLVNTFLLETFLHITMKRMGYYYLTHVLVGATLELEYYLM